MKKESIRWVSGGLLVFASLVAGCNQQMAREQPDLIAGPSLDTSYPGATLVLGTEELVGAIRLSAPRFRRVGQLTQAQVTVQNLTDSRYSLEYRFGWEDSQGFKAGDPGSWHRFSLAPRQIETFTSTGKVPEATNIVFTVRYPDAAFIRKPDDEK